MPSHKSKYRSRSPKSHKSSPRKSKPFYTKNRCQSLLKKKISINMKEYNKGKFVSRPQAVAVSYSQVRKSFPGCKRFLGAKSPKKSSRKMSPKRSRQSKKSYKFQEEYPY